MHQLIIDLTGRDDKYIKDLESLLYSNGVRYTITKTG